MNTLRQNSIYTGHPVEGTRALEFEGVSLRVWDSLSRVWRWVLRDVEWQVQAGEHWAVLGPNGAGKTSVLNTAGGRLDPTTGLVTVLGRRFSAPGLLDPRNDIGVVEAIPGTFAHRLTARDVVMTRASASAALRGRRISADEVARANELLRAFGCRHLAPQRYGDCSEGERKRIQLARALIRDPSLLLLDEPASGLDLPGRELLLQAMARLASTRPDLTTVTVTHHFEELASSTTHVLLLRSGQVVAAGPIDEMLTEDHLEACFGVRVSVVRLGERWVVGTSGGAVARA